MHPRKHGDSWGLTENGSLKTNQAAGFILCHLHHGNMEYSLIGVPYKGQVGVQEG